MGLMESLVIRYKNFILKVFSSKNCTTIWDSYQVESYKDMKEIIYCIKPEVSLEDAINTRRVSSMIHEWRVHNLLYSLGIFKRRTKSVDLDINQPWYLKVLYTIISPLYLHFS